MSGGEDPRETIKHKRSVTQKVTFQPFQSRLELAAHSFGGSRGKDWNLQFNPGRPPTHRPSHERAKSGIRFFAEFRPGIDLFDYLFCAINDELAGLKVQGTGLALTMAPSVPGYRSSLLGPNKLSRPGMMPVLF